MIEIVKTVQTALMWVCLSALAAMLAGMAIYASRNKIVFIIAAWRKLGLFGQLVLTPFFLVFFVYGSTKREVVTNLEVDAGPDSVICTWNEADASVSAVIIQRRLKGATEEEAWENVGFCNGGVKHLEIDGFTIDRNYEYRAKYIYTE